MDAKKKKHELEIKTKKYNEFTVSKDKQIIDAAYNLTLVELRIILANISTINPLSKITRDMVFFLSPEEYSIFFGVSENTARKELKQGAETLFNREIKVFNVNDDGKKTGTTHRWLSAKIKEEEDSGVIKEKGDGVVGIQFSEEIIPFLTNIKPPFSTYKLREVSKMKSVNSIRIYELMIQYKLYKKRTIPLDALREFLMTGTKYPRYYDFKKNILESAKKEINKLSDINISIKEIKKGTTVTSLVFSFKYKKAPAKRTITNKIISEKRLTGESNVEVATRLVATGNYKHAKIKNDRTTNTDGLMDQLREEAKMGLIDYPDELSFKDNLDKPTFGDNFKETGIFREKTEQKDDDLTAHCEEIS